MSPKYERPQALELDEPYLTLRGQDLLAPYAVMAYGALLRAAAHGCGEGNRRELLRRQADEVEQIASEMIAWQSMNRGKLPD